MDPTELDLRDIHLPPDPAWWPPAIGWWLLAGAIIALAVVGWMRWQRYRADRVRRDALSALEELVARSAGDPAMLLTELSIWFRRVALSVGERRDLAALTGSAWLSALHRLSPGSSLDDYESLLTQAPYRRIDSGSAQVDVDGVVAAAREWTANLELAN